VAFLTESRIRGRFYCCVAGNPGTLRSKNISTKGLRNRRSLRSATPDFLLSLVALVILMRLSLTKAAHVAMSSAAWQEIRVRSVEKHFHEGSAEPQVPPLRFAPVGGCDFFGASPPTN
jgi:hypothetical protein